MLLQPDTLFPDSAGYSFGDILVNQQLSEKTVPLPDIVRIPAEWSELSPVSWSARETAQVEAALQLAAEALQAKNPPGFEEHFDKLLQQAGILVELAAGHEAVIACLLHQASLRASLSHQEIEKHMGSTIATLVDGISRMDVIHAYSHYDSRPGANEQRVENLRKMLLAMVDDVRVVLVKLAERLQVMRHLEGYESNQQQAIARETMDIFAPLANRLGVWQLKWELEDLSLRCLDQATYKQIARKLAEKRGHRESYIQTFIETLQSELVKAGIKAEISGRPKHIYSIWKKMKRKDLEFEYIFDVRAVRVLVDDIPNCYTALGIVHTLWPYIAGEFDDYIATPKDNNYQSIHTAVIGPEGKVMEVQIRTREMHENSELGVAAHWRYKEGAGHDDSLERKVLWLRQLLEWREELSAADDLMEQFKSAVFEYRVYVFTPQGNVIDLPEGATPVDFAFAIHTEVGYRCRGAKVNGQIVPLTYKLKTGEQVEILVVKNGAPSRDWLSTHAGYIQTPRARLAIQRWFKLENYESKVSAGRAALEKEFQRLGVQEINLEKLAQDLNYKKVDDFMAAIGSGYLKTSQAVTKLKSRLNIQSLTGTRRQRTTPDSKSTSGFIIEGVGNLLTQMASCCKPLPGDAIVGYITRGRGVTIHRQDCVNALHLSENQAERLVEVNWSGEKLETYPVELLVSAFDRHNLLHDITTVMSDLKVNLLAVKLDTDAQENIATINLSIEVSDIQRLSKILQRIEQIPNVTDVRRLMN